VSVAATTVGGVLQILGVLLVFVQIGSAEKLLGAASWAKQFANWLKAHLPIRRNVAVVTGAGGLAITTGVARITIKHSPGTTVDERLASLQAQIDDARRELEELWTRSTTDRAELSASLAAVNATVRVLDAELRGLIAALTIGSRHLQVAGAMLIILGTALIVAGPFLP